MPDDPYEITDEAVWLAESMADALDAYAAHQVEEHQHEVRLFDVIAALSMVLARTVTMAETDRDTYRDVIMKEFLPHAFKSEFEMADEDAKGTIQ